MSAIEQLDYLAALDSGNASIRWPQKDVELAAKLKDSYSSDIERILKLNLLWRPFVAIRTIEIFDNLALMHFLVTHADDCRKLADADLLRVTTPGAKSFEEMFTKWALAGGQDDPMHFHHLSPREQSRYDSACRAGKLKSAVDIARHLGLEQRGLNLLEVFKLLDRLFPARRLLVLASTRELGRMWYADRVEQKWKSYMDFRKNAEVQGTTVTTAIERTLEKCWRAGGRRRMFYSELEANVRPEKLRTSKNAVVPEIVQTKVLVLNDAFYDEYEQFDTLKRNREEKPVRIVAVRDVTLGKPAGSRKPEVNEEEADLISADFSPLDAIRFSDIVRFHTGIDAEAHEFQESIANLQILYKDRVFESVADAALRAGVTRHLNAVYKCALKALQSRNEQNLIREARGTVWFNYPRAIDRIAVSAAAPVLSTAGLFFSDLPTSTSGAALVFGILFCVFFESKTRTDAWYEIEASVRETIETGRQARRDADQNPEVKARQSN